MAVSASMNSRLATNSLRAMLQRWIISIPTFHDQYERNGEPCHAVPNDGYHTGRDVMSPEHGPQRLPDYP